eukprot:m.127365 g.127365  ORF g.127365 m.127365 type:complete len:109 (+) comp15655_c5_seq1:166-492(+)
MKTTTAHHPIWKRKQNNKQGDRVEQIEVHKPIWSCRPHEEQELMMTVRPDDKGDNSKMQDGDERSNTSDMMWMIDMMWIIWLSIDDASIILASLLVDFLDASMVDMPS